jgi:hypothetical protein
MRKIIQLIYTPAALVPHSGQAGEIEPASVYPKLVALCDDGTVWVRALFWRDSSWAPMDVTGVTSGEIK